jgi:hypothetical protein
VFQNNFLWYKLLALIYDLNPFSAFSSGIAFYLSHILRNTSLPKNVPLLCRTMIWEILFPLLSLLHFYSLITHANYLFRRNKTTL